MSHRENPIVPTVGRTVLVRGTHVHSLDPHREMPAIVTEVIDKNTLTVEVFGRGREANLILDADYRPNLGLPIVGAGWRWMDYQVQQGAKAVTPEKVSDVSTPLSRLQDELHDLSTRFTALGNFLGSAGFRALSMTRQDLLGAQHSAMQVYRSILLQRTQLLTAEA